MVTNKILIFGSSGQIGQAFTQQKLPEDWYVKSVNSTECDFIKPNEIGKIIQDFAPELVINAAAMTNIEACEKDPEKAKEINFHAVANIAAQCSTMDAPLIHLSTDYVFDGTDQKPYGVEDGMNPLNVYGQTKMMGEEAVRHSLYWHVILRTSLVFSSLGNNVFTKTLRAINTQNEVQAASDQRACPTSAKAVAECLLTIATAILNGKGNGFGTFHICGEPAVSRYEFLQAIMESYAPYTDRRPKLAPLLAEHMPSRVKRPASSILDCSQIREVYGIDQHNWHDDLAHAIKEYVDHQG